MNWQGITVGYALTGSHCTLEEIMPQIKRFVDEGARVIPIVSHSVQATDTRFGKSADWLEQVKEITRQELITSIPEAEPLGPSKLLDVLVIAPCTGNTTSKLANAMTDSPVLMAAKAQMRNQRPLVLAISTNDGLGLNAMNIAKLLITKHVYFVPFGQDAPEAKPNSLVARMDLVPEACAAALQGKQLQPLIIERFQYA
ncbi:dipicolinate synthase subunit B [Paenibacillus larvae]|uniref:Dipicolinate synthase, B chain n=5 Tax=Paenibacillus larvae TaxID=1464 RepID=V9W6Y2_9BACL|nr:dipicolinate synthase subunit B [Paenibacillus larvae]AHD05903.1 dipicolinate synthase, B chain [Paenibacillus larvae subsp. larvae DSM 25430]AQR76650.1 dipicolinate synthase subunit B [Paenibacillus larvae subsp. larvae]AQZ48733.1 dipicolinate synthase subunit B [Paenibacillus larvae subsp. pulvifaciens]ARF69963.1 dipicolinate synthase subunit B [Paenibacillus larvae subsp. pulvifaciens]AVF22490.1 dipicolinate synthase, B chain [Paenibacillus larvae subsp. larvae]